MSMPTFPQIDPPLTREGSLNEIISSIAAEELSLSHILNAEGEKLQYVLGTLPGLGEAAAFEEVMDVNRSVQDTLSDVMEQQALLTDEELPEDKQSEIMARLNRYNKAKVQIAKKLQRLIL